MHKYNKLWLFLVIGGTAFGLVMSSVLFIGFPLAGIILERVVPQKHLVKVKKILWVGFATGMTILLLFQFGSLGYQDAKEDYHKFPELDSNVTAASVKLLTNRVNH